MCSSSFSCSFRRSRSWCCRSPTRRQRRAAWATHAGGGGRVRRVLGVLAGRPPRPCRREPLPPLRGPGPPRNLVSQRHHRGRSDQRGRCPPSCRGDRPVKGRLPIASDYPQNLFTALGGRYSLNVDEPITNLCPERLCGRERTGSARSRLRALFDDLSVVSAHLLLPRTSNTGCRQSTATSPAFATPAATRPVRRRV